MVPAPVALMRKTSTDQYMKNMVLGVMLGEQVIAQTWGMAKCLQNLSSKPRC